MDKNKVLVGVAWPYANGLQHIGHIAGAYLPPDIFARFYRMRGHEVLMVSGSDTHGTPVTLEAQEQGVTPQEVITQYHPLFIESYLGLGLTFDLYTHTDTEVHWKATQDMFLKHMENGLVYKDTLRQLYDPEAAHFLPDRYVVGNCPECGAAGARGDQCDACGRLYDALELRNPKSTISGCTELEVRETEHFFLDLGKMNEDLLAWIQVDKSFWRPQVYRFTLAELERHELRGRPITRDIDWGVAIPVEGYEDKRIYVWYDAVIGYLSAVQEYALLSGQPDAWEDWWKTGSQQGSRIYNFIGKDNIPFHTIIWPAMLMGRRDFCLPYDVPANEYLNMKGRKFSKSRGVIIAINDVLERYQPDAWRYALTAVAPETSDVDFSWDDFVERINNELVANWGNLVHRVLGFTYRACDGQVPAPEPLHGDDRVLLAKVERGFVEIGILYDEVKLRSALEACRRLSQRVNQYLNAQAPWQVIKEDRERAHTILYVALQAVDWLKLMWAPILPFASQRLHEDLGYTGQLFGRQFTEEVADARGTHLVLRYDHSGAVGSWEAGTLPAGQVLRQPRILFEKLDAEAVLQREQPASETAEGTNGTGQGSSLGKPQS